MDGEQGRDQKNAECEAGDTAVPGDIGLPQGGNGDRKQQNEDHESADVETKAPHGMVSQSSDMEWGRR
jgi:hypothetical protein